MGLVEPLPSIDVPRETFETAETLGDTDARMRELRRLHDVAHGRSHLGAISARSRATGRCGVSAAHPGMIRPRRYLGHISQRAHPQCDRGLGDGDDGGGGAERPAATAALDAGDGGAAAHVRRGGPPLRLRSPPPALIFARVTPPVATRDGPPPARASRGRGPASGAPRAARAARPCRGRARARASARARRRRRWRNGAGGGAWLSSGCVLGRDDSLEWRVARGGGLKTGRWPNWRLDR